METDSQPSAWYELRMRLMTLVSTPVIARLQLLVARVTALPWPEPAQRVAQQVTERGIRALTKRFPEVAALIGVHAPRSSRSKPVAPVEVSDAIEVAPTLAALRSGTWAERSAAARAFAGSRDPETVSALIAALRDRSIEVASSAASALAASGSEVASSALVDVVKNQDGYYAQSTRAAAVQALGTLLPKSVLSTLRGVLRDVDAEVSLAAIAALARRKDEDSIFDLTQIVEDSQRFFLPITRLAAARGLELMHVIDGSTISRLLDRETDQAVQQVLQRIAVSRR